MQTAECRSSRVPALSAVMLDECQDLSVASSPNLRQRRSEVARGYTLVRPAHPFRSGALYLDPPDELIYLLGLKVSPAPWSME